MELMFRSDNKNYSNGNGKMAKFMLSLRTENYEILQREAAYRGITVQELLRAVIVPDWMKAYRQRD